MPSLETVRRITIRARTEGAEKATADLRALAGAQSGVAVASQRTERATLSMEKRLESIQRRYDTNYRQQQDIAKVTRDLDAVRAQGFVSMERQNELLAMQAGGFDKSAKGARGLLASIGGLRGIGAAFGIGSLLQLPRVIGDIASEGAGLVETAKQIGITTKELQELRYAGKGAEVEASQIDEAFKKLSKTMGEAAAGKADDFRKVLQANNVALFDNQGKLRKTMEVALDYADLIKRAANEQGRNVLSTIAFGKANDELGRIFAGGRQGIRDYGNELERLNGVTSPEELQRLAAIDKQFDDLGTTLARWAKGAVVAAADAASAAWGSNGKLTSSLNDFVTNPKLETYLRFMVGDYAGALAKLLGRPIEDQINRAGKADALGPTGALAGKGLVGEPARMSPRDFALRFDPTIFGPTVIPKLKDDDQTKERERLRKQFDDALKSSAKQTEGLRVQAETFGMAAGPLAEYTKRQELLFLAEQNHIALTPTLLASIEDQATKYGDATAALERMRDAQEAQNFLARSLFDAVRGADSLAEAFSNLASKIADAALEAALLGSGPLAGLFGTTSQSGGFLGSLVSGIGSLFGGGGINFGGGIGHNASGNDNWKGGPTWVGEQGPEIVNLPRGTNIVPFHKAAGGGGQTVNDNRTFHIDARGAQRGVGEEIRAALMQYDKVLPTRVAQISADPRAR